MFYVQTKTNHGKRALSLLLTVMMMASLVIVVPINAGAFSYGDPVYLEFFEDVSTYQPRDNLELVHTFGTPPGHPAHLSIFGASMDLLARYGANWTANAFKAYEGDSVRFTYNTVAGKSRFTALMKYDDFIKGYYGHAGSYVDWNTVTPRMVMTPEDFSATGSSRSITIPGYYDWGASYADIPHMILVSQLFTEKKNAISMTVSSKPSLQLDYEGAGYAIDAQGFPKWNISAVITNTADYPVYITPSVEYYRINGDGSETKLTDATGYTLYADPSDEKTTWDGIPYYDFEDRIIDDSGATDLIMLPPGAQFEYIPSCMVHPPKAGDEIIKAVITCVNMTSNDLEKTIGSASTLFPKATGIKNGVKLTGYFPNQVSPDEEFTVSLFGLNFDKILTDSIMMKAPGGVGYDTPIPETDIISRTGDKMDIQFPAGIEEGSSYFEFEDSDGYFHYFTVQASTEFVTPVWPVYGILAVTQSPSGTTHSVEGAADEKDLQALESVATPLLTFRGMARQDSADTYYISEGATINGIARFMCQDEFDDELKTLKVTKTSGGVTIESQSDYAVILYDGTVVAGGKFTIELNNATSYSVDRAVAGERVRLTYPSGTGAWFDFTVFGMGVKAGALVIYSNAIGISGSFSLGDVVPLYFKQYFNVELNLEELQLNHHGMPGIKANAELTIGDMFGIIQSGAEMKFSMNTLPEVEGTSDYHIYMMGDVNIYNFLMVRGELRLEQAMGIFFPESFEFFVRGGAIGIPLIPALQLATINGFGGGVSGLASTIDQRFRYVPDISLSFLGAISDITTELISLNEGKFTVGLRGVEGKATSLTVLGMEGLIKNTGYSFKLTDAKYPTVTIGGVSLPVMSVEASVSGEFNLLDIVTGRGSVWVAFDPSAVGGGGNWDAVIAKIQNMNPGVIWDILDTVDFKGTASGEVKVPNFVPVFGGWILAGGKAELTKYYGSIRVGTTVGAVYQECGILVTFPYKNQMPGISLLSIDGVSGAGDTNKVSVLNIVRKKPVGYSGIQRLSATTPRSVAVFNPLLMPLTGADGSWTVDATSGDPNLVFSLEASAPQAVTYTITAPNGVVSSPFTTPMTSSFEPGDIYSDEWVAIYDDHGAITGYRFLHYIDNPDSGEWTLTITSPSSGITIDAATIYAMPEINSVTYSSSGTVDWTTTDLKTGVTTYSVDLFIVPEANKDDELGRYLTTVDTTSGAGGGDISADIPKDLPDGEYVIRAMLIEHNSGVSTAISSALSGSVTYSNPNTPGDVTSVSVAPNGNGSVKVNWSSVTGADGYVVTVLDDAGKPMTDGDGLELTPTIVPSGTLPLNTECILQGGNGYIYGTDYKVSVAAYNEVELGEQFVTDSAGNVTGDTETVYARLTGTSATSSAFKFAAPTPPTVTVSFSGAAKTQESDDTIPVYVGQSPFAIVTVPADCGYEITRNGDTYDSSGSSGMDIGVDCLPDVEEGAYTFVVTVTDTSSLDSTEKRFVLVKDTTPPILQIDAAGVVENADGTISFAGNTEPGATLAMSGIVSGDFTIDPSNLALFSFRGTVTGNLLELTATDLAGNVEKLTRSIGSQATAVLSISVSTEIGGVIPLSLTPKLTVTAADSSGNDKVLTAADPVDINITNITGIAATLGGGWILEPSQTGTIIVNAEYTDDYGRILTAGCALEIVDALTIGDLAYTPSGTNGANLTFTPPTGTASVKLQYSTDDTNWSDYLQGTLNASGGTAILSNLAYDTTHYFRVFVTGGLNNGPSNSVAILRMKPSTSSPPSVPGDSGSYVAAPTGAANAVASDNMSKITDLGGGVSLYTPEGQDPAIGDDGSMTLPGGGTITTPGAGAPPPSEEGGSQGGVTITVPPGTVIDKDGKISFPNGSGGGTITYGNGQTFNIRENAVIILDLDTPLGYYISLDNPFGDVRQSDWFYDPVMFAYAHGLMNGTSENPMMFSPNSPLTRGMIVTVLYRMAGSPDVSELPNPFGDVSEDMYYTNAVIWAAANGIVNGYSGGLYGPEDNITRQDLAVILARYANYMGIQLPPNSSLQTPKYTDDADIADYAQEAIERFFEAGIINGYPDGSFKPQGQATRAEFAAMLMRFIEAVE